ncbi:MAG TPA: hypothetical protein V6C86_02560 [Oculatellaceae cyanobacterium]
MMSKKPRIAVIVTLVVLASCFLLAFFVRPHSLSFQTTDPPDDYAILPQHADRLPLATRISRGNSLALVLTFSAYSRENGSAFLAMREWGTEMFQKDPTFLYATQIGQQFEVPSSIFGSFVYNVLFGPRIVVEDQVLHVIRKQIHAFHKTDVYEQIRNDYYESFGKDKESALLLANYEFDRAKMAVPAVLSALFWLVMILIGIHRAVKVHKTISDKIQKSLSGMWLTLALFYLIETWSHNSVQVLMSSILCAATGFYLRKPIVASLQADGALTFKLITLNIKPLILIAFASLSLVAIHLITWIKTGSLQNPDPVTLFLFAASGNFFHDPIFQKRVLERLLGVLWLIALAWVIRIMTMEQEIDLEAPERLDSLVTREI